MNAFGAFLAVGLMTAAILFAGAAWAMEIQKFDKVAVPRRRRPDVQVYGPRARRHGSHS